MKALHPLTEEQRIFAEKHHDFIYQYLNGRAPEYRGLLRYRSLWLSESRTGLSGETELQQYRFATIARIAHAGCTGNRMKKQNRPMRRDYLEEYQEDTAELDVSFLPAGGRLAEAMDDRNRLLALLAYLTAKERQVVHLQADGYTYHEIAEICNITSHGVHSRFYRSAEKYGVWME